LLYHQHNPEILPNNNLLICDSENNRIIEINYTSKEIVWTWDNNGNLRWPRDCDYIGSGKYMGSYLITDSINSRIIILEPKTKTIQLIISAHLIVPYEADHVPSEDSFIVGNSFNTQFIKFDNLGQIIFFTGIPIIGFFMILNSCFFIGFYGIKFYQNLKSGKKITHKKNIECLLYIGLLIFFILFYNVIFSTLFQVLLFPVMEILI
jgi:hypothetical protein